jgi:F-type H+-transporting ATPase subunit gamma
MPPPLKIIKNRIRSIANVEKITSAMQMISVVKLSRTQRTLHSMNSYYQKLEGLLHHLLTCSQVSNPFFEAPDPSKPVGLCVFTSDSGLCGTYNNNVLRHTEGFIREKGREKIRLILIGKKANSYFLRNYKDVPIIKSFVGWNGRYVPQECDGVAHYLNELYLSGEVKEIHIAYMLFGGALRLRPTIVKYLNLERKKEFEDKDVIMDPDLKTIVSALVPKYLLCQFRFLALNAFTSEHASRVISMKVATENAKELISSLTLLRNKVRQANITQDIMEIISSAEALKG